MRSDRMILIVVPLIALAIAFWLLLIAPNRSESSELGEQVDALQSRISQAEGQIAAGELARDNFSENYGQLVSLGRAAPEEGSEQATLVYDMAGLSKRNDLTFRDFVVTQAGEEAAPPPPPESTPAEQAEERAEPTAEEAPPVQAVPTEVVAATLPIGASAGPAGLPVMPYEFRFAGNFFDIATFFGDIDDGVTYNQKNGKVSANGRLLTINGFSLTGDTLDGFPNVTANFSVTSYLVPPEQGLQAGATPAGPPAIGAPEPTPVASTGETP